MEQMVEIRRLSADEARAHLRELAEVLADCVEGGASVSFMASFSREDGVRFFEMVAEGVEVGERVLLAAFIDGRLIGTVQMITALPPNQPHRADVAKLLVHRSARGRGVGEALMNAIDEEARREGKTLLVLDAVTGGDGARLYSRLGWVEVGSIPNYALYPDGRFCATTYFYKEVH
jgi:GNAT superfamily N-acetyltransferase